ncbi:DUF7133 domain-containing protein [Spirosoma montaniterrae]|uniref:Dehydrogenase n=1 Tax=Spirosoma montaniterrae TaxID=1178516 RepID=A0A1P9WTW6_9BACT|nr:c-type cytochrome [Spirosoma montaniterrae]AQG78822.1 dehydrogenase [Spirosoma montaniterrae]
MKKPVIFLSLLFLVIGGLLSLGLRSVHSPTDELSPVRSPQEELSTFQLEPDLTIQLVASEPMVQDPVAISFDAAGRLWVVEMRGYMATLDADGEQQPSGRVSVLEDTNGDGQMDRSHVFLDSLVMPRAMALVAGGILIAENGALWLAEDRNNDLRADSKLLIDKTYAAGGLPEHAPNGLWRGLDNWLYSAKGRVRYRLVNKRWQRDSTEMRGQWGMSHDDAGRLVYNYNWSQLHADLVPPNYLSRNKNHTPTTGIDHGLTLDRRIYPIRSNRAVNRGYIPGTLDKQGRLLEFTSACSPFVYRGTLLPEAYRGNVFVCENAGNLIKRNVVTQRGVLLTAHDPHPGREFMASTDERFRPVALASGPDGALYVADMYRGIVQHGAYMTPYLREQTLARKLEQPAHLGRIWRIVPKEKTQVTARKLADASATELVAALSSADGWQRDMAQRLLIERNDNRAGLALVELVRQGREPLGRMHALWTLDALPQTSASAGTRPSDRPALLFDALTDPDLLVSNAALRLLEPLARQDKTIREKLGDYLLATWSNAPIERVLQIALSASVLDAPRKLPLLAGIVTRYDTLALIRDATLSSLPGQEFDLLQRLWASSDWQTRQPAKEIFLEMLATAVIRNRNPAQLNALLATLQTTPANGNWREKAVLTGLSIGGNPAKPVRLATAPPILTKSASPNTTLATVATLFTWPGHERPGRDRLDQASRVAKPLLAADDQKQFAMGRQLYLSTCSGCHGTDGAGMPRFGPPLAGSDWVTGDEKRLALILLHGMEGPVKVGKRVYDVPEILPVMPAHSTMDDGSLTAILTYIRNEWGNQAGPMGKRTVGMTRVTAQGRLTPWTAKELEALPATAASAPQSPNR